MTQRTQLYPRLVQGTNACLDNSFPLQRHSSWLANSAGRHYFSNSTNFAIFISGKDLALKVDDPNRILPTCIMRYLSIMKRKTFIYFAASLITTSHLPTAIGFAQTTFWRAFWEKSALSISFSLPITNLAQPDLEIKSNPVISEYPNLSFGLTLLETWCVQN